MIKTVFPNLEHEMQAQRYTLRSLCDESGLKYVTIYNKVKTGENLKLSEALVIKATLKSKLAVEKLFQRAG